MAPARSRHVATLYRCVVNTVIYGDKDDGAPRLHAMETLVIGDVVTSSISGYCYDYVHNVAAITHATSRVCCLFAAGAGYGYAVIAGWLLVDTPGHERFTLSFTPMTHVAAVC